MIRTEYMEEALLHLVGWRFEGDRKLSPGDMTKTESGLYFQGAHPYVTLSNIAAVMPEKTEYPQYEESTVYVRGDIVSYGGKEYVCVSDKPGAPPDGWEEYDAFKSFLERLTRDGIDRMVSNFVSGKSVSGQTKSLLYRGSLFDGAGNRKNVTEKRGAIVGFAISPVNSMGVTVKIDRIGFQGYGAPATFRLYVFHSGHSEPIGEMEVSTGGKGGFTWIVPGTLTLPYENEYGDGGTYYICYDEKELPAGLEAVNFGRDWSRDPCGTCNKGSLKTWKTLTSKVGISPFFANADIKDGIWDEDMNVYTPSTNYGINFEFSIHCDLTGLIVSQRQIFAPVLQKQVAADVLRLLALNPEVRVNRRQLNVTREQALYELDKTTDGTKGGLSYELSKAYEALSLDTKGIDPICLCKGNRGVKYGAV